MDAAEGESNFEDGAIMDEQTTQNHGNGTLPASLPMEESAEALRLRGLDALVQDQDDLERNIGREADRLLFEQANQRDQQRLDKARSQKEKLQNSIRRTRDEISRPIGVTQRNKLRLEVDRMQGQIQNLDNDIAEIQERIGERETQAVVSEQQPASSTRRLPNETQRDYLIRTGKITPFSKLGLSTHGESSQTLQGALFDAEEEPEFGGTDPEIQGEASMSHRNLRQPGFASNVAYTSGEEDFESEQPRKRRRLQAKRPALNDEDDSYDEGTSQDEVISDSAEEADFEEEDLPSTAGKKRRARGKAATQADDETEDFRGVDDGTEAVYRRRLNRWATRRRQARVRASAQDLEATEENEDSDSIAEAEAHLPHPEIADTVFDNGYKLPGDIYPSLFDYQKTGVQWLYELYNQQVGGIIGDEMGLGKTIQIIAFLAGLHYSKKLDKPIIVVCPATVMKQWVNEFHRWWPPFRVTILHSSGSGMVNIRNEASNEDRLFDMEWDPNERNKPLTAAQKGARKVLKPILEHGGVLVTTYSGLQTYAPLLIPVNWQYAILDEGHKIRNPNTAITIYCKELRTPNRIILSGTPMQNNLIELWSLFDFVFPMRLGTLVNFRNQFEIPIRQGGYANASNLQVQTAFKCAETLKDAISPYLLQRFKIDVASDLPKKSEQVLFCKLTAMQRKEYKSFISSGELDAIMNGKRQVLYGVDILRKICNHPDLVDHKRLSIKPGYNYGDPSKSGKMQVVGSLLELWKETGHKTLLFAQHRIMLDVLERYVRSLSGFKYRRMDGNTPIQMRQSMVDEFNTDPALHVFLLTTKVGGLGINLTGADRVIIYDPDWNPSTDLQARERAWRLGQKREVTIYRLMTAGTIEEKIYHRQIFKQFLTNKILKDPKQRQTFHLNDLHDLFTLGNEGEPTETSTLFQNAQVKYSKPADTPSISTSDADKPAETGNGDTNIEALPGISSVEQFAGEVEEEQRANREGASNSEDKMMEGIFARSGIHSAVEHDAIIDGTSASKKVAADPVLIEQEARKVAAEAAKELRRAGEVARTIPIGTPTWTGQFGVSGRPQETTASRAFSSNARARGGGLQSSSLLANLQQRQGAAISSRNGTPRTSSPVRSTGSAASTSRASTPTLPQGKDFGKLIRDYLSSHGGSVYTQMLIDHFNRFCTTPQATLEFKETLKLIARLEKGSRGRGRWVLKDEYKT
ncbi:DNA excision repair protein ERCC-6 [Exophiala viscosa]|uniref:DNA excision repair protein ERCC-6 n=1 Tax=Exophiala viscosa TaxID=2486360 RepID=A0AAN6II05_9EURO|nr:DNA excision repair protein ERCC-6 [Exophiala viscosa]